MSIFQKIKESITRPFKKNNSNRDSFAAFLEVSDLARELEEESEQEKTTPLKCGIDLSEQDDFVSYGLHNALGLSEDNVTELIELGKLKPFRNIPSRRLKKATHIYKSTKNKRIKNKQLKIMIKERNRYGNYSDFR
ncbi:hypothetical protein P7H75_14210 [Vagococcus carniphilus]|uniref:hypothetical protein n=1 Tax=Vagococcus carniphilus TaxID=218144 RepID=UPI00288E4BB4|nr:hypothetical protein [Vagococcus carniphilus]MDT2816010.1 hypothetical protein [Vagococcus carniphilus]